MLCRFFVCRNVCMVVHCLKTMEFTMEIFKTRWCCLFLRLVLTFVLLIRNPY